MSELNRQIMPVKKTATGQQTKGAVTSMPKRLDLDFIGKPAKLLNHDEVVEWFEGEPELWQENY